MLLEQSLEPGPLVATLAREVFLGVVQFVLVEIELRLREIQGIAGVFAQFFHAFLVRVDALLQPVDAVAQLPQAAVGGQGGRGFGLGLAQGRGEGKVELMVCQAPGFVRLRLLIGRNRQRSQLSGRTGAGSYLPVAARRRRNCSVERRSWPNRAWRNTPQKGRPPTGLPKPRPAGS